MLWVIREAVDLYHNNKEAWRGLQKEGMTADFSWTTPPRNTLIFTSASPAEAGLKTPSASAEGFLILQLGVLVKTAWNRENPSRFCTLLYIDAPWKI